MTLCSVCGLVAELEAGKCCHCLSREVYDRAEDEIRELQAAARAQIDDLMQQLQSQASAYDMQIAEIRASAREQIDEIIQEVRNRH